MVAGRYLAPLPDDEDFPPLGIARQIFRELGLAILLIALIVLGFAGYQFLGTKLTEEHGQTELRQAFTQAIAAHAATVPPTTTGVTTTLPKPPIPVATTIPGAQSTTPAATAPTTAAGATTAPGATVPTTPTTAPTTPAAAAASPDNPVMAETVADTVTATPANGQVLDHLQIPAIGVDKYVVQGTSRADLSNGPGHYPDTVLPGQVGNAAIAGHRVTYGAPFFRLDSLKKGDRILVTDRLDRHFTYEVASVTVVPPSDVAVLAPSKTAELTLTTCNPRFGASSRLIVVATMTTPGAAPAVTTPNATATTAPTTTPTTTSPTTTTPGQATATSATTSVPTTTVPVSLPGRLAAAGLGTGDQSARGRATLYGLLLLLVWVMTRVSIHLTHRWWRTLGYVVGIVGSLVLLWYFLQEVVKVLPTSL